MGPITLRSHFLRFFSKVGGNFLYNPILSQQKRKWPELGKELTKQLHIWAEVRYREKKHFYQIWRHGDVLTSRDVTWRHFWILTIKCDDVSKCYPQGEPNNAFSKRAFWDGKMSGQPFLYDFLLKSSGDFQYLSDLSDIWWRQQKNDVTMTSSANFWRLLKVFMSLYYRAKFQVPGASIRDFMKGADYTPLRHTEP